MASVRIVGLTKRYGAREVLRGVNLTVVRGEILGLLGPNGAGKTTLLECLLGLRAPDAGTIHLEDVDALASPARARRLVGAQLQAATLQDQVTPREALGLFASFHADAAPVGELLGRFGLAEKADARFSTLSGGQRQRLFLALAFVNRPGVAVLDEPTAGLDPQARRALHDLIAAERAAGRTVLLSTHDLDEAERLCDRVALIDAGKILAVARPAELIAGSRQVPRLHVRTAQPVPAERWSGLAGVTDCQLRDGAWVLGSGDLTRTIAALMRLLEGEGNALLDLQIRRPTLEDVFLELTGHAWPAAEEAGGAP